MVILQDLEISKIQQYIVYSYLFDRTTNEKIREW